MRLDRTFPLASGHVAVVIDVPDEIWISIEKAEIPESWREPSFTKGLQEATGLLIDWCASLEFDVEGDDMPEDVDEEALFESIKAYFLAHANDYAA